MINFVRLFTSVNYIFILLYFKINALDEKQRIKLRDIEVLTFYKDKTTTGNRVDGIPQLKCIGGYSNCYNYAPNAVQCYNKGFDGVDVQWECKADLDKRVRFGILKVICEGYEYASDPFVLAGSCGLEYSIEYITKSPKHYGDYYHKDLYETSKLSNFLSLAIIVIIMLAVYKSCTKNRENDPRHDFNATYAQIINQSDSVNTNEVIYPPPPPPYGFDPIYSETNPPPAGFKPEVITNEQNTSSNNDNPNSNGWSSFLTGAAVGGIGTYLFNKRNDFTGWPEPRTESPPPSYDSDQNNSTTSTGFATTSRR